MIQKSAVRSIGGLGVSLGAKHNNTREERQSELLIHVGGEAAQRMTYMGSRLGDHRRRPWLCY